MAETISLSLQIGFTISIPLVVLAFVGRMLDKKFDSSPFLLLVGIFLAFLISMTIILFKIKKIFHDLDKEK